MNDRVTHFYRKFRAHQRTVCAKGGGMLTVYPGARTEQSYASAPYGEHALCAFVSARRHVAFLDRLAADVRADVRKARR